MIPEWFGTKRWKEMVHPEIRQHLAELINKTRLQSYAYKQSESPHAAQLWVALAEVTKDVKQLNARLESLEQTLQTRRASQFRDTDLIESVREF